MALRADLRRGLATSWNFRIMSKKKASFALRRETDPLPFLAVIAWCEKNGLPVARCSDYQLKCAGSWSFYTKGTFHLDGDSKRRGAGFVAFKIAVETWLDDESLRTP